MNRVVGIYIYTLFAHFSTSITFGLEIESVMQRCKTKEKRFLVLFFFGSISQAID
jgi:hypothetical protein